MEYDSLPIHPILLFYQDVSMELKAGQITALVGLNRSGKSTCVKLLERFYQPRTGKILLDDKPLESYKDQYLHEKVGHFFHFIFESLEHLADIDIKVSVVISLKVP